LASGRETFARILPPSVVSSPARRAASSRVSMLVCVMAHHPAIAPALRTLTSGPAGQRPCTLWSRLLPRSGPPELRMTAASPRISPVLNRPRSSIFMTRAPAAPIASGPGGTAWEASARLLDELGAHVLELAGHMGPYAPLAVAGTVVWVVWLVRALLSWTTPPIESDFRTTTSVIVPSYHEDVEILMECLDTWREQDPSEIIIVLDTADTEAHARITALGDPRIQALLFDHVGK